MLFWHVTSNIHPRDLQFGSPQVLPWIFSFHVLHCLPFIECVTFFACNLANIVGWLWPWHFPLTFTYAFDLGWIWNSAFSSWTWCGYLLRVTAIPGNRWPGTGNTPGVNQPREWNWPREWTQPREWTRNCSNPFVACKYDWTCIPNPSTFNSSTTPTK